MNGICEVCKHGLMSFSNYCGCYVCENCSNHHRLARCFCGWTASGTGDGRRELEAMGETIDPEPDAGWPDD